MEFIVFQTTLSDSDLSIFWLKYFKMPSPQENPSTAESSPILIKKGSLSSHWRAKVELPLFLFIVTSMIHRSVYQAFIFDKSCQTIYANDSTACQNSTSMHENVQVHTLANHLNWLFNTGHVLLGVPMTMILGE